MSGKGASTCSNDVAAIQVIHPRLCLHDEFGTVCYNSVRFGTREVLQRRRENSGTPNPFGMIVIRRLKGIFNGGCGRFCYYLKVGAGTLFFNDVAAVQVSHILSGKVISKEVVVLFIVKPETGGKSEKETERQTDREEGRERTHLPTNLKACRSHAPKHLKGMVWCCFLSISKTWLKWRCRKK